MCIWAPNDRCIFLYIRMCCELWESQDPIRENQLYTHLIYLRYLPAPQYLAEAVAVVHARSAAVYSNLRGVFNLKFYLCNHLTVTRLSNRFNHHHLCRAVCARVSRRGKLLTCKIYKKLFFSVTDHHGHDNNVALTIVVPCMWRRTISTLIIPCLCVAWVQNKDHEPSIFTSWLRTLHD